jgi:hypothetical protein
MAMTVAGLMPKLRANSRVGQAVAAEGHDIANLVVAGLFA